STELFPGIRHARLTTETPRLMCINFIRVDLANPHIRFVTNLADKDAGKPVPDCAPDKNGKPRFFIRTRRTTTGDFMEFCRKPVKDGGMGLPVVLAVNASPWTPWEKPFTHKYSDNMGLMVSGGRLICPSNGRSGLVITKKRTLEFRDFPKGNVDISDIHIALCGFSMILKGDKIIVADNTKDLHPRTVYGLSADKRFLYIITVDGRQKEYSLGASLYECAQLMLYAGAADAMNMDGGGSTTLVKYDDQEKKPLLLNRPSSGGKYQRPVANTLGIYYR
ncbi:MAG: phosphodiester glycosidase family protein, partial [Victivallales bacterium]|nr:phosphodiester glycosidase family protein [Victivallales bacterium]